MANSIVQSATQTTGTGATLARSVSATVQNNLVVAWVGIRDLNETCTGVVDDKGNTYTLIGPVDSSSNVRLYAAYARQVIGGVTSITANFSGSTSSKGIRAEEYHTDVSGQVLTFDTSSTGNGTSSGSLSVTLFVPAATGELIVAGGQSSGSVNWTAGLNYTLNASGTIFLTSEYRLSGTLAETSPISNDGAGNWSEIAIAFKTAVPAPTASNFLIMFQ